MAFLPLGNFTSSLVPCFVIENYTIHFLHFSNVIGSLKMATQVYCVNFDNALLNLVDQLTIC
jgi:hypothetical protein